MRPTVRWLGILVASLLAGCLHAPVTSDERVASLAPHRERRVEGEPLPAYVAQRTALLVGGLGRDAEPDLPRSSLGDIVAAVRGRYALGAATAIDRRGYLLTAAHCLAWQPLHVVVGDATGLRIASARVVWHGNPAQEGSDLALLAIDQELPHWFTWAADVGNGEPVVSAGPEYARPADLGIGCFAGVTVKIAAQPRSTTVYHKSPVRVGDSGGPLANLEGRLLAVNVGDIQELNLLRLSYHQAARAHRPDPTWLRATIERDFTASPAARSAGAAAAHPER